MPFAMDLVNELYKINGLSVTDFRICRPSSLRLPAMTAISRASEEQTEGFTSWPVTRYSTVVLQAAAILQAASALGYIFFFFHVDKVDCWIPVCTSTNRSF